MYREFCDLLNISIEKISKAEDIPFLPIEMFKSRNVLCGDSSEITFTSSGTSGETSKHMIKDLAVYKDSFLKGFELAYGDPKKYCFCCLLPSYLEREGSSLIYMAEKLISISKNQNSGFFLNDFEALRNTLEINQKTGVKTILLGVSFALLDFVEKFHLNFPELIVMETGGMKGRREEITRDKLHTKLKAGFGVKTIHSEYGMTELLSQAYSKGDGLFSTPPWMKILIRDVSDPLNYLDNKTGVVNIIDLANIHSCSFIATSDLGKKYQNDSFEILGRLDNSDIRGCNLMVGNL